MKRQLVGATLFGIWFILLAVASLLSSLYLWVFAQPKVPCHPFPALLHVFGIASGIGVLRRQRWALLLTLLLAGFWIFWNVARRVVIEYGALSTPTRATIVLTLVWNGMILWYFLRPSVRAYLGIGESVVLMDNGPSADAVIPVKHSVGVTLLGFLYIVPSVLNLVSFAINPEDAAQLLSGHPELAPFVPSAVQAQNAVVSSGVYVFFNGVVPNGVMNMANLAAGVGILMLRRWALYLALILAGISIIRAIAFLACFPSGTPAPYLGVVFYAILSLGWNGFILWFLLWPSVQAQFRKKT